MRWLLMISIAKEYSNFLKTRDTSRPRLERWYGGVMKESRIPTPPFVYLIDALSTRSPHSHLRGQACWAYFGKLYVLAHIYVELQASHTVANVPS